MAEAIMCHYSNNAVLLAYSRKTRTNLHWILQLVGSVCSIWGIVDKMVYKEVHFTTTHGKLGSYVGFTFLSALWGVFGGIYFLVNGVGFVKMIEEVDDLWALLLMGGSAQLHSKCSKIT